MAGEFEADLIGAKELEHALRKLPQRIEGRVLRQALRAAGGEIVKEARRLAPKRTGTLAKSLGVVARRAGPNQAAVAVTARSGKKRKNDGWYAHLIEFGWDSPKGRVKAQPFLRPAVDAKAGAAISKFGEKLQERIAIEAKKLAGGG